MPTPRELYCPVIFDGWRCWPSTKAGDIAYVGCPSNQPGFSAEREYSNPSVRFPNISQVHSLTQEQMTVFFNLNDTLKHAGKAYKICTQNGTWYRHPMTNRYWSNYTTCVDTVDLAVSVQIRIYASFGLSRLNGPKVFLFSISN